MLTQPQKRESNLRNTHSIDKFFYIDFKTSLFTNRDGLDIFYKKIILSFEIIYHFNGFPTYSFSIE